MNIHKKYTIVKKRLKNRCLIGCLSIERIKIGNYLSLLILIKRSKRKYFSYILDRIQKKVNGWKKQKFSYVGKNINKVIRNYWILFVKT